MDEKILKTSLELMSCYSAGMIGIESAKKHCSAILLNQEVMAVGFNRYKTSQIAYEFGYLFGEYHAELDALIKVHGEIVKFQRKDLTLINFRINRFSNLGMSRPCPKCIRWASNLFGTFVYTDIDGGITIEDVETGVVRKLMSKELIRKNLGWKAEACHA